MTLEEIKTELEKMVPSFAAKIAPVYRTLNLKWDWSPGKSTPHLPSVGEIENALYSLIEGLTDTRVKVSTGSLSAYLHMPDDIEYGRYGLAFKCQEEMAFD